ncbi:maleylpyruvate isomerase N-terminal domain-containing protein [Actinophytocola sp.]|uniref:maleylpyruvate isomerase N-terminal domain-containing protein n=1 Tax=Actinophytocola sp. TaxID=1872138 RepID=UPI00389A21A2
MPVTAQDVDLSVRLAIEALTGAPDKWDVPAGTLEWTCWETVEHVADDLFFYATQIGCCASPREVPFGYGPRREGGPALTITARREAGPDGLLQVLEACGALLTAVVRTAAPQARAYHIFGEGDPEGFAAMGSLEVLVHTHDIAAGLGVPWQPPADLCARVLARLFPDVTPADDPWLTLLWATGRHDLPDRAHRTEWRWHSAPLSQA